MKEFIFGINAIMPVFIIMVLGYFLMRKGFFNPGFNEVCNKYAFNVALPTLLFKNMYETNLNGAENMDFIIFCALSITISFIVIWVVSAIIIKDKSITGCFVQGACRGNVAILGVAFIQSMYGTVAEAALMVAVVVPIINVYSVILLCSYDTATVASRRGEAVKKAAFNICKNPLIIGILAGLILNATNIKLPTIAFKTVEMIGDTATPMSLLVLGACFSFGATRSKITPTLIASFVKLFLMPAIIVPAAVYFGFRGSALATLLIMAGTPTAISSFIMAKNMNGDAALASGIVTITTLISAFSLTVWIFALRTLNLI